jgi:ATP-dependent exoDNAse (exonuclease V) beta subunit
LLGLHLDASGYLDGLGARGRANVEKFLRLLTRWEEAAPGSPGTWLEEIGRMRARGEEAAAAPAGAEDAVTLMSIHGAKGLEFKVVFVTRLERGTRRDADPVDWTREEGLGFAWRDPRDDEAVPDPALERIRMARADREAEEAGRLLYVAATRAEDHLVFTWRTPERGAPAWVAAVEGAFGFDPNLPAGEAVAREGIRYLRATQPAGEPAVSEAVAGAPEEELLDRMEAQPARGSGYAVTAVGRYLQCPRQWMLDQAALPEEEEEAEGARFGSVVHALLAGEEPGEATEAERAYAARFAGSPLGWRMAAARRVEREYDFLFAFEESVFRGRIDLWFEEADGRRIVVDYKTGKRPDAETLEAYRTQLRLYRRAVPGGADELWLAFLGDRSEEQVEGEAGDGLLRAFLDGTARGEYPMRPGEGCGPCRHFGGLCRPEGGE